MANIENKEKELTQEELERKAQEEFEAENRKQEILWDELQKLVKLNCSDRVVVTEDKIYCLDKNERGIVFKKTDKEDWLTMGVLSPLYIHDNYVDKMHNEEINLKDDEEEIKEFAKYLTTYFMKEDALQANHKTHDADFILNKSIIPIIQKDEKEPLGKLENTIENLNNINSDKNEDNDILRTYYISKTKNIFDKELNDNKYDYLRERIAKNYKDEWNKVEKIAKIEQTNLEDNEKERIEALIDLVEQRTLINKVGRAISDKGREIVNKFEQRIESVGQWRSDNLEKINDVFKDLKERVVNIVPNTKTKITSYYEKAKIINEIKKNNNELAKQFEKQEKAQEKMNDNIQWKAEKSSSIKEKFRNELKKTNEKWEESKENLLEKIRKDVNAKEKKLREDIKTKSALENKVLSKEEIEEKLEAVKKNLIETNFNDSVKEKVDDKFKAKIEKIGTKYKGELNELNKYANPIIHELNEKWEKINQKIEQLNEHRKDIDKDIKNWEEKHQDRFDR